MIREISWASGVCLLAWQGFIYWFGTPSAAIQLSWLIPSRDSACFLSKTQVSAFPWSPRSVLCPLCVQDRERLQCYPLCKHHQHHLKPGRKSKFVSFNSARDSKWQSEDQQPRFSQPLQTTCKYIKLEKPWAVLDPLFLDISKHSSLLGRGWSEVQWL